MARTTAAAVRTLLTTGNDYDTERTPSLTPFVDAAYSITNRVSACATTKGLTIDSTDLELIERWVAAHLYCMADPIYQSKSHGGASGQFQGQSGLYLDQTRYGQTALTLDWTGCLAAVSTKARAYAFWGGKTRANAQTFEQRNPGSAG